VKRRRLRAVAVGDKIFQHGYGAVQFDENGVEIPPKKRSGGKSGPKEKAWVPYYKRSENDQYTHELAIQSTMRERPKAHRPPRPGERGYEAWCRADQKDDWLGCARGGEADGREDYQQARHDDGMKPILFADDDGDREESKLHIEAAGNTRMCHRKRTPRHLLPLHVAVGRIGAVERRSRVGRRIMDILETDAIMASTASNAGRPILQPTKGSTAA
jgi:hypothetical protein